MNAKANKQAAADVAAPAPVRGRGEGAVGPAKGEEVNAKGEEVNAKGEEVNAKGEEINAKGAIRNEIVAAFDSFESGRGALDALCKRMIDGEVSGGDVLDYIVETMPQGTKLPAAPRLLTIRARLSQIGKSGYGQEPVEGKDYLGYGIVTKDGPERGDIYLVQPKVNAKAKDWRKDAAKALRIGIGSVKLEDLIKEIGITDAKVFSAWIEKHAPSED